MPFDDPAFLDLSSLFRDPDMFESRRHWDLGVMMMMTSGKTLVQVVPATRQPRHRPRNWLTWSLCSKLVQVVPATRQPRP